MKVLITALTIIISSSSFAETLHIGRFTSLSAKEDESLVKIESANVTAFASTSGASLAIKGCNAGKISTGETGPYGTSYKSINVDQVLQSQIITETRLDIKQAQDSLRLLKASLKKKIPFYCSIDSVIAVELKVRVLNTNRLAKAILTLRSTSEGLVVDTVNGTQSINADITIVEAL